MPLKKISLDFDANSWYHERFNFVMLGAIGILVSIILFQWFCMDDISILSFKGNIFWYFYTICGVYMIIDTVWICMNSSFLQFGSPRIIISHHIAAIAAIGMVCVANDDVSKLLWCAGIATEINTWFKTLRNLISDHASLWYKFVLVCFYVSWVLTRCILFPFVVFWCLFKYFIFGDMTLSIVWKISFPVIVMFMLLNIYWTTDLLWNRLNCCSNGNNLNKKKT